MYTSHSASGATVTQTRRGGEGREGEGGWGEGGTQHGPGVMMHATLPPRQVPPLIMLTRRDLMRDSLQTTQGAAFRLTPRPALPRTVVPQRHHRLSTRPTRRA